MSFPTPPGRAPSPGLSSLPGLDGHTAAGCLANGHPAAFSITEALDVALEHARWLATRRSHQRTLADDMAALGYRELERPGRRKAYHIRIATLAAEWMLLRKHGVIHEG